MHETAEVGVPSRNRVLLTPGVLSDSVSSYAALAPGALRGAAQLGTVRR